MKTSQCLSMWVMVCVFLMTGFCSFAATDVLFLVDTTGSDSGNLNNLKTAFNGIVEAIDANSPCPDTIMYGVADYRNYFDGDNYTLYGVNLDQPFTFSIQDTWSAINGLSTDGGGDTPESQLKAMESITENWLTTSGDLGFNGREEAQKIIIWAGDAPGHVSGDESGGSPPAGYYPTLDETIESLTDQGIIVFALNTTDCDSGLNQLYDGRRQASEITDATGGELFCSVGSGSSEIEDTIVDAINCYSFIKDDDLDDANDLDCRSPGQELIYSICLTNDSDQTLYDVSIIDWLDPGVTYPEGLWRLDPNLVPIAPDPYYDPNTHSYFWQLDPIGPNESVCVELTVVVNEIAEPGMYLHNIAELIVGESIVATTTKDTLVCCWDTNGILYVDKNAPDGGSGTNWETAYNNLDDALTRAGATQCAEVYTVYVASETYAPQDTENGFVVPDGVSVYGGFKSGGSDFTERSPKRYETILTGLIDDDAFPDVDTVVTMGDETLLDGFTVTQARENGIYGDSVDFTIENCTIEKSFRYGIYARDGNVTIKWCKVLLNDWHGIRHNGAGYTLTIENCWILRNGEHGLWCNNSTPTVKNCIVSESDLNEFGRAGIRLYRPTYSPVLYNNTISNNKAEGIFFTDDGDVYGDPNNLDYPDIQNCIVYYNNNGGPQLSSSLNPDAIAKYCCIQDCNELNTLNYNDEPGFAYTVDPNDIPDPNNYHLAYDAFCKDKASPYLTYTGQVDIDGEGTDRQYGDAVDIGADEIYACDGDLTENDISNALDWNADGVVNLNEFSKFQKAWLSRDPNDPSITDPNLIDPNDFTNWNPACNLIKTGDSAYIIDLPDIVSFIDDTPWLWKACWRDNYVKVYGMSSGGDSVAEAFSFGISAEAWSGSDTIVSADETHPYAEMPDSELVPLVVGIYDIIEHIETSIIEGHENAENLLEAKDFLEEVLADIQASRQ